MITSEQLLGTPKDQLPALSRELENEDLEILVAWLSEKNDKLRYQSLLLLQNRATFEKDVYPYWDLFQEKLISDNSYQRSIGLMMIAVNVKWDKDKKFEEIFDDYCSLLNDDKPITIRQCIQSFQEIVPYKAELSSRIAQVLMEIDVMNVRETMRKLILSDVIQILFLIRNNGKSEEIDNYISKALLGDILDKKMKKSIEAKL